MVNSTTKKRKTKWTKGDKGYEDEDINVQREGDTGAEVLLFGTGVATIDCCCIVNLDETKGKEEKENNLLDMPTKFFFA